MPPPANDDFFLYECDACGAPVCERMLLYTLANGLEEETLCLNCLSAHLEIPLETLKPKTYRYMQSRDCFRKPWHQADVSTCPWRGSEKCCSMVNGKVC